VTSESARFPGREYEPKVCPVCSFAGPDSPHLSGQCDNPERIALILDASTAVVTRSLDHDIEPNTSLARAANLRRKHRRDHPERNYKTPRRTGEQAGSEEDYEWDIA
jgi:hypothetical protein